MTRKELLTMISYRHRLERREARRNLALIVDDIFAAIMTEVAAGRKVTIPGFGTFKLNERAEHKLLNPRTGEQMTVPAHKTPSFKAGKTFRDRVKGGD